MADLIDLLSQSLNPDTVRNLSRRIDATPEQTEAALSAALPMMIGALSRNANASPQGALSLGTALDRDHDGGLLDQLGGLLGGLGGGTAPTRGGSSGTVGGAGGLDLGGLLESAGSILGGGGPGTRSRSLDGGGILDHVFGRRKQPVEDGLSKSSGLSGAQIRQLLLFLAPLVMAALGRMKRQKNLDSDGVAVELDRQRRRVEEQTPGLGRGGLGSILDRDNDGQVLDDVAELGSVLARSGALGSLFGRR